MMRGWLECSMWLAALYGATRARGNKVLSDEALETWARRAPGRSVTARA